MELICIYLRQVASVAQFSQGQDLSYGVKLHKSHLKQDLCSETSWVVLIANLTRISLVKSFFAKVQYEDINWCTFQKSGAHTCF